MSNALALIRVSLKSLIANYTNISRFTLHRLLIVTRPHATYVSPCIQNTFLYLINCQRIIRMYLHYRRIFKRHSSISRYKSSPLFNLTFSNYIFCWLSFFSLKALSLISSYLDGKHLLTFSIMENKWRSTRLTVIKNCVTFLQLFCKKPLFSSRLFSKREEERKRDAQIIFSHERARIECRRERCITEGCEIANPTVRRGSVINKWQAVVR